MEYKNNMISTPSTNAQCQSKSWHWSEMPNTVDHCRSLPINSGQSELRGIDRHWLAIIGIDRHWNQCYNCDRHWALIERVLIFITPKASNLVMVQLNSFGPPREYKALPQEWPKHLDTLTQMQSSFYQPHSRKIMYLVVSVCLSVLTTGVLLASRCIHIPTYWLLFLLAITGMLATVRVQKWGCWLNKPAKKQTHPHKKSDCMCLK